MMEIPPVIRPERTLSTAERIELYRTLNGLPLSQLLELEFALDVPQGIMPPPLERQGLRTRVLLDWVGGSTGIGWDKFLDVLRDVTGISLTCRSQRLKVVIEGDIAEADSTLLLKMLAEFQTQAQAPSLKISSIREGSIELILQGTPEEIDRLRELIDSGQLTEFVGQRIGDVEKIIDLSHANLSSANLIRADLIHADLSGADLSGANLSGADLSGANLSGANLSGANLSGANLSGADLSRADLIHADLGGADLGGADLGGADLRQAILRHVALSGADLSRAILSDTDLSRADLMQANLSHAILSHANLSDADLSDADLSHAILSHALLNDTDLSHAILFRTDLSRAILRSTIFGNNQGLDQADKIDLIERGAIFRDTPGSDAPVLV